MHISIVVYPAEIRTFSQCFCFCLFAFFAVLPSIPFGCFRLSKHMAKNVPDTQSYLPNSQQTKIIKKANKKMCLRAVHMHCGCDKNALWLFQAKHFEFAFSSNNRLFCFPKFWRDTSILMSDFGWCRDTRSETDWKYALELSVLQTITNDNMTSWRLSSAWFMVISHCTLKC